jgi:hypothetical protein
VNYRVLSVITSIKMTLNIKDIVISITSLIGCSNRLKFIVVIAEMLKMLLKRYNFN